VEEPEEGDGNEPASSVSLLAVSREAEAMREGRLLLGEGDRLQEAGELTAARETWQQAAETFERAGAPLEASEAWQRIGFSHLEPTEIPTLSQKDLGAVLAPFFRSIQDAASVLEEARRKDLSPSSQEETRADRAEELYERASERILDPQVSTQQACKEAMPLLVEAKELFRQAGSQIGEIKSQLFEAHCHVDPENPVSTLTALPVLFDALQTLSSMPLGDSTTQLDLEAGDLLANGDLDLAETKYLELLDRYEEEGDRSGVAGALMDLGALYGQRGEYEAALERSCAALDASRSVDDEYRLQNLGAIHHNLGGIARDLGRPTVAAEEMTMALTIWRALGRPDREAGTLAVLGKTQADLGWLNEGRATLEAARSLQDELSPDPAVQAVILNNLAAVLYQQGSYREALQYQQEAADLVPIDLPTLPVHLNQDLLWTMLGSMSGATLGSTATLGPGLDRLEPLLQCQEATGLFLAGEIEQALGALSRAFKGMAEGGFGGIEMQQIPDQLDQILGTGGPGSQIGLDNIDLSRLGESSPLLQQYLQLVQAKVAASHGRVEEARATAQSLLERFESQGDPMGRLLSHIALVSIHLCNAQNPPGAIPHMEAAVGLLDEISSSLPSQMQASFHGTLLARSLFDGTTLAAFLSEHPRLALEISERSRARAVLTQLGRLDEDLEARLLAVPGSDPESEKGRDEAQQLRLRIAFLEKRLATPSLQGFEHAREREVLQQELDDLQRRFDLESRRAAVTTEATTPSEALTLDGIQARLSEDVALVEYHLFDLNLIDFVERLPGAKSCCRPPVLAWVIDAQDVVALSLEVDGETLRQEIQAFRALLATRDAGWRDASQSLYLHLIAPLRSHLDPHTTLWLVPHRSLHHLPFAALLDPETGRLLIEDFQITHLPSASSLGLLPQESSDSPGHGVLAVGDPDGSLPAAAREASAIARLFPGAEVLSGAAARESEVRRSVGHHRVLHFATHGRYDTEHPLFSHLQLLSDQHHDGRLEAHEILELDLRGTDLVVLSGCETGTAEPTGGDEVPSLSRAFLAAGAHNVLASLWRVEDQATADLMERFYRHWKAGESSADALRRAQLDTRKRYPHPYDWAGFEISGRGD